MKLKLNELRDLIETIVSEATDDESLQGDSLDSQLDRYFSEYERASKNAQAEGKSFRALTRRLLEADEDAGKQPAGDLNIEEFADNVVRLVENYDSLLEVRSTIAKRAINFIAKIYDKDTVKELLTLLRYQHE